MGPAPFHEHIFAFPIFFHVCSLWTVETPTRPCLACEFGVLAGPPVVAAVGTWQERAWPTPGWFSTARRCPGEAILLRSGPHTDGTSSRGQLSPLHKAPEPPGGGKWHFARWLGSLRLPVTCTTMSAQQTQGCLFPDVVPVPRRLHQPLFSN